MKRDIHPDYHTISVRMTSGETFVTRSTWGSEGDVLRLEVDPLTHPAWTGGRQHVSAAGRAARFAKRFGNVGAPSAAAPPAKSGQEDGEGSN